MKLIEKDNYLLETVRYIVLNPVRDSICAKPGDWKWSSYKPTVGLASPLDFLETDWTLKRFSPQRSDALKKFDAFVAEGKSFFSGIKDLDMLYFKAKIDF